MPNRTRALSAGYAAALSEFRLEFSRAGAYACIVLVLLGIALDSALYPQRQGGFALARIAVSALVFAITLLMRGAWGKSRIQWLTFVWLMLPQIMIAAMIALTQGAGSLYYVGLTLAMYASGIVLAFGLWQNLVFGGVSYLLYVAACGCHAGRVELSAPFVVNSLFLLMSAAISAVFTFYSERARFTLFKLKAEVVAKNTELELTNKNLANNVMGQMLQQEKMAAIGTLAAGLLHEVNNPVNFCLMAIDVAMEEPGARASPMLVECLSDAKEGMLRVQHIVSDLKKFAYRKSGTRLECSHFLFERALAASVRLVGYELKDVAVRCDLPDDTLVSGDEAAITGVLINLLGNAVLSMRKAQRLPFEILVAAAWNGERLRVTVRDNGPGIAPENLSRVFEPFFTTREVGQGLGLGLSISYSVVERHGGTLLAESVVGEWTSMHFDLPRAAWEGR